MAAVAVYKIPLPHFIQPAIAANAPFNYWVIILMENQGLCSIYVPCGGSANYETNIANQYSLSTTWGTIDHNSEPNYIALLGGFDDTATKNDGVCCYFETQRNLVDLIETAGLSWTAWAEDASGSGTCAFHPPRNGDHFGFIDFADMNTAGRCGHFQTTSGANDNEFIAGLQNSPTNLEWLTPNDCNNMHDCGIVTGDNYLANLVPRILATPLFTNPANKAVLQITFDEGYTGCTNTGGTGECVYSAYIGSPVKRAYQSSTPNESHYSFIHTLESSWGLGSLGAGDATAPTVLDAFTSAPPPPGQLSTSFTVSPTNPAAQQPVTFTSTTSGGLPPYTTSWTFGDNIIGNGATATHAYQNAGTYNVVENVHDASSPPLTASTTQPVIVTINQPPPPSSGNFTGCANLPGGWNCGNLGLQGGAGIATITNGVAIESLSNIGGGPNAYAYATTQKGTFPWSPCQAPAPGVLPTNLATVQTTFLLSALSNPTGRIHVYIALYYWLPNGAVVAGGSSYRCLDTQSRAENINGIWSAIGKQETYNPGDGFGWDQVTLGGLAVGSTYTITASVVGQCAGDLAAWGLPASTICQLAGIEIGVEGYTAAQIAADFSTVSLLTGAGGPPPPPTTYSLVINATMGGSTNPAAGTYTYTAGVTVSITAIPSSGYNFTQFILDNAATTVNPILVIMNGPHTVAPIFAAKGQTCTNGAVNPPLCTITPNGCSNGANNPPACTTCPQGFNYGSGQCTVSTTLPSWIVPAAAIGGLGSAAAVFGVVLARPRKQGK